MCRYSLMGSRWLAALAGALVAAGCGIGAAPELRVEVAPTPTPQTEATMLRRGVDVSAASGAVDWQRVAVAGLSFAVVRASNGLAVDPAFAANWQGLSATPLVRGAAHAFVVDDDPAAQARVFLAAVELRAGDLAPIVEVEALDDTAPQGAADRLQILLDALEARWQVPPIIVTRAATWDAHLPDTFGRYPLWVVDHKVAQPALPHGWTGWHLWEFRSAHDFAGIERRAGLSRGNGAIDDLARVFIP